MAAAVPAGEIVQPSKIVRKADAGAGIESDDWVCGATPRPTSAATVRAIGKRNDMSKDAGTRTSAARQPVGQRGDAVLSKHVKDGEIASSDVADNGLTGADIDEATLNVLLSDGSVTTTKLADAAVTIPKLAFDPATQAELDAVATARRRPTTRSAPNPGDRRSDRRRVDRYRGPDRRVDHERRRGQRSGDRRREAGDDQRAGQGRRRGVVVADCAAQPSADVRRRRCSTGRPRR